MKLIYLPTIISGLLFISIPTISSAFVYFVKKNDSLSRIAKTHLRGPVYGKDGALNKIYKSNPKVINPHLIFPGDRIEIPLEGEITSEEKNISPQQESHQQTSIIFSQEQVIPPEDGSKTSLELIPSFGATTLSATDSVSGAKSTVASSLLMSVDGRFLQTWNDSFSSYLRAKISYVSFDDSTSGMKTLSSKSKFLTTFGIGSMTKISPRLTLGLSADLEKNLFVRAASTTSIVVDSVLVPSMGAKLSYELIKMNAFSIKTSGVFEHKFQANTDIYSVKQGSLFGGTIGVNRKNTGREIFQVDLGAFKRSQDTSATTQSETIYTLFLTIPFSFGEFKVLK